MRLKPFVASLFPSSRKTFIAAISLFSAVVIGGVVWAEPPQTGGSGADIEPPVLQFSVNDLVLSQTGSQDKENLEELCDGDRVLEWNGTPVQNNRELVAAWLACAGLDSVPVKVQRRLESEGAAETKELMIDYRLLYASRIFPDCLSGGRQFFPEIDKLYPELDSADANPLEQALRETWADDAGPALDELRDVFQRLTDHIPGYYRTDSIAFLLNRPLQAIGWGEHASRELAEQDRLEDLVGEGIRMIWMQPEPVSELEYSRDIPQPSTWLELCTWLSEEVQAIKELLEQATSGMTGEERATWRQWCVDVRPLWKGETGWDPFAAGFQLTKKLDQATLAGAWLRAARLSDALRPGGELYQAIQALADEPPAESTIGLVRIAAGDDSVHEEFLPITIELGGNDRYVFPTNGLDPNFPVRLIVDLGGEDHYRGTRNGVAAGVAGVSVLIDAGGDDRYEIEKNGMAFAVCGLGVLDDHEGNDVYSGKLFIQGAACVGVAMLVDRAGNDVYDAGHYSQAIGMPGGCGAVIDFAGDDQYRCSGKFGSPYGDVGEFSGMGQGCGLGFRYLGFGGVGILQDRSGRDFYRAGQFGLGCGYFFGVGLVNDRSGEDVYECSRYGLGTAAHYAAGLVLDDAGDDIYLANRRSAVAEMGSAWDLSLGALVDASGNDVYRCRSYALGGAAQNSYGFFWDRAGDDAYLTSNNTAATGGYIGGAQYGAGRGAENLAIFLDGAGDDVYSDEKTNQASGKNNTYGIWVDR